MQAVIPYAYVQAVIPYATIHKKSNLQRYAFAHAIAYTPTPEHERFVPGTCKYLPGNRGGLPRDRLGALPWWRLGLGLHPALLRLTGPLPPVHYSSMKLALKAGDSYVVMAG